MDSEKVLEKLRKICLAQPAAEEVVTWGHPTFRAPKKKTFCVFEKFNGVWSIVIKVGMEHQALFLKDPRFYLTPYIGKKGWVSLRTDGKLDWKEIRHLVAESYRLVAPKLPS